MATPHYSITCINVDTNKIMFDDRPMEASFVPSVDDYMRLPDGRIYRVIGRVYDMVKNISCGENIPVVLYCQDMTDRLEMLAKENNYASNDKA